MIEPFNKLPRWLVLIGLGAIALIGGAGIVLLPILLQQLGDLATRLPDWLESGSQQFQVVDAWLATKQIPLNVTALAEKVAQALPNELVQIPDQALEILLSFADRLAEVLITGVLTLYLILHGDEFWHGLVSWLPGDLSASIRSAFQEQFRNYFVGQATIALIMAVALTTLFFLFKIPYWLVFGVGIGLLALFPFGDTLGILIAGVIVSFKSFFWVEKSLP
ncbi:AI-2E family transporter [Nodosilinea sp. LEGE 07088]|uniref:AI-2E family transporter n=1 Tax=Nodosilinea sp. LEGE 07088 TaxID=2777968 RepID=UPI002105B86C|nr:AI-2E family transporter [Nodosilinea sp. LEGE 07088]